VWYVMGVRFHFASNVVLSAVGAYQECMPSLCFLMLSALLLQMPVLAPKAKFIPQLSAA
jgi:hypothetical protein